MDSNEAVRRRIRILCEEHNLTPYGLSAVSGINWSTLNNILSGKNKTVTISTIKKICDGLEIDLPTFFSPQFF